MKFYRYWVRKSGTIRHDDGREQCIQVCGGSNDSPEAASADADARIARVQARVLTKTRTAADAEYEQPIREEVVTELTPHDVVTRNWYGALVLNTDSLIFVDIDYDKTVPRRRWWQLIFGRKAPEPEELAQRVLHAVRQTAQQPGYCDCMIRVYRTRAGLRLLVAGLECKPGSSAFEQLMCDFQADPLYALLCDKQGCTRARLTPKPYRIRQRGLRHMWPCTPEEVEKQAVWRTEYEKRSRSYAVCHFVESLGKECLTDSPVIAYHDEQTSAHTNLPLA